MVGKEKDATQEKGVSAEEEKTQTEIEEEERSTAPISRREEAIDAIMDNVEKERAEEMGIEPEELGRQEGEKEPGEKETETAPEKKSEEEEPDMVTIIVDGEEMQVPRDDVVQAGIQTLQKEVTADKRLEEATMILQQAQQMSPAEGPPSTASTEQGEEGAPSEKGEDEGEPKKSNLEEMMDIVKAIQYGEEEDAAKALLKFKSMVGEGQQTAPPAFDPGKLEQTIDHAMKQREISARFRRPPKEGGFADLLDDPILHDITMSSIDDALAAGAPDDEWETYEEVGKKVRAWRSKIAGGSGVADPGDLDAKRERKKTLDDVQGVNLTTESSVSESEKPPKVSDIIKEMREARHQPV